MDRSMIAIGTRVTVKHNGREGTVIATTVWDESRTTYDVVFDNRNGSYGHYADELSTETRATRIEAAARCLVGALQISGAGSLSARGYDALEDLKRELGNGEKP
jgi:hypothetical protein